MVKIGVIFYSTYGHTWKLAEKLAEGAKSVGAEVEILRIPETLSDEILGKMGGLEARKQWSHYPVVTPDDLKRFDAIALGVPTRFGIPPAQVKTFIDSLGQVWMSGATVGKFATVFGCSGAQHGGNETNLIFSMLPLYHLGFTLVGLPYSYKGQMEDKVIAGGSPYGATSVSLKTKDVIPVEADGAFHQGKNLVQVMTKYSLGAGPADKKTAGCWCF